MNGGTVASELSDRQRRVRALEKLLTHNHPAEAVARLKGLLVAAREHLSELERAER